MLTILLLDAGTTTPPIAYFTLGAAVLAAGVSIYSTITNSKTAKEIKIQEYKNDFYKKIIDKRIKAWEEAEKTIGMLNTSTSLSENSDGMKEFMPNYFYSETLLNALLDNMRASFALNFWLGGAYANHVANFHHILTLIRGKCFVPGTGGNGTGHIDTLLLWEAGKKYNDVCDKALSRMSNLLRLELKNLHNVEAFFKNNIW